jgi:hypothetical protein
MLNRKVDHIDDNNFKKLVGYKDNKNRGNGNRLLHIVLKKIRRMFSEIKKKRKKSVVRFK